MVGLVIASIVLSGVQVWQHFRQRRLAKENEELGGHIRKLYLELRHGPQAANELGGLLPDWQGLADRIIAAIQPTLEEYRRFGQRLNAAEVKINVP